MVHTKLYSDVRSFLGSQSDVPQSWCDSLLRIMCKYRGLLITLFACLSMRQAAFLLLALLTCRTAWNIMYAQLAAPTSSVLYRFYRPHRFALTQGTRCVVLLLVFHLCLAQPTQSSFVSSSAISYCRDPGDEKLNCAKKMVVSVTVDGGQREGQESLLLLNSAEESTLGNTTTVQFSPIRITVSRSAVRYRYPIFYVQNYNAKPYESTVKGQLLNQCNAEFDARKATCGLAYDDAGRAIPYSQGFCCDCSACQSLGFCSPGARASVSCNVLNHYTTASCLRFHELWYAGYTIGGYITWYTLNVTLSRDVSRRSDSEGSAKTTVTQKAVLQLSTSNRGDKADGGWNVMASILGTFASEDQPLDLTSRMLFAPISPPGNRRVQSGTEEWMLIPSSFVTLNGRECDKIGVSYEAFASQGNRCNLQHGSCLNSQLDDYRASDLKRITAGNRGLYMVPSFGNFSIERGTNKSPFLTHFPASPAATVVRITASADDLVYIVNLAVGRILSASLNKAVIRADSQDGIMTVVVRNSATVTGRLVVGLINCTEGVLPMTARVLSLEPQQKSTVTFDVHVRSAGMITDANCTIVVRNVEEEITDSYTISWKVSPTEFTNGTQGGSVDGNDSIFTEELSAVSCARCSYLNILCAMQRWCWRLFLLNVLGYLVIVGVVLCVSCFWRSLCSCLRCKEERAPRNHHIGDVEAVQMDQLSQWESHLRGRPKIGSVNSSRLLDSDDCRSAYTLLQTAAQASLPLPPPPLTSVTMLNPAHMYYSEPGFSTVGSCFAPASPIAYPMYLPEDTSHLSAMPPSPTRMFSPAPLPSAARCPYGDDDAFLENPYLPAQDFLLNSPARTVPFTSSLTPSRVTRVGSLCSEDDASHAAGTVQHVSAL